MKKRSVTLVIALLLAVTMVFSLSACSVADLAAMLGTGSAQTPSTESSGGNNNGAAAPTNGDYMTREEVMALINGIKPEVNVASRDITITSNHEQNLLAASKGVLSVVRIVSGFTILKQDMWGRVYETSATSNGAGVIYKLDKTTGDAYIITNYHVVYESTSKASDGISTNIQLYLYGQEYEDYAISASFIGGAIDYDIAVLKVSGSGVLKESSAEEATLADSDDISLLQTAIAIGNPASGGIAATVGCVSVDSEIITLDALDGTNRDINIRVIRTDAAINGGNSGGGLFDSKGNVIGIVNAKLSSSSIDNISFAIPANRAKYIADNVIYYDSQPAYTADNCAYRYVLGIGEFQVSSASVDYDEETGRVSRKESVSVSKLSSGTMAAEKLAVGDIVNTMTVSNAQGSVTYNITRSYQVSELMLTVRPGDKVTLGISRGGVAQSVEFDFSAQSLVKT